MALDLSVVSLEEVEGRAEAQGEQVSTGGRDRPGDLSACFQVVLEAKRGWGVKI